MEIRFYSIVLILLFSFSSFAKTQKQRVGVIGAGGAGLAAAWLLDHEFNVTLIEKSNRLGGNAYTIDVQLDSHSKQTFPIDAGFEFMTQKEFPYFMRYLDLLGVSVSPFELTSTFFSSETGKGFVVTPFSDERTEFLSILNPFTLQKLINLKRLFSKARLFIDRLDLFDIREVSKPLESFMNDFGFVEDIKKEFLYPFLGAGWGATQEEIKKYSAYYLFSTLLTETNGIAAPTWYEIKGGTGTYIRAVTQQLHHSKVLLDTSVVQITWDNGIYHVVTSTGEILDFESLVIATPLSQMKTLLKDLEGYEDLISSANQVKYSETNVYLHGDLNFMPREKKEWSVVNVRSIRDGERSGMSTYKSWHSLKGFPIIKSWIFPEDRIPDQVYGQAQFYHPHLDENYCKSQEVVRKHQGKNGLYFAGVQTQETDRHEGAIKSAVWVVKKMAPHSRRLQDLLSQL